MIGKILNKAILKRQRTGRKVNGLPIYVNLKNRELQTTKTQTITDDKGYHYNVPSFDSKTGLDYKTPQQKYDAAYKRDGKVKRYKDLNKAVAAAKAKSDAKGRKMKAMAEAARRKKK
jgi:hypothetical protein